MTKWHVELQNTAIATKMITLPTGRQYWFPKCKRNQWGNATGATQIKNYPVQGFATADVVPSAVILLHRLMKENNCKSLLINTVHDSIVVDIFPGEEELINELYHKAMLDLLVVDLKDRYGIDIILPLEIEIKRGPNWLDSAKCGKFVVEPPKHFTNTVA